jgi:tRNA uridine 5-carboxymethylaminomethyl modification enzyme
VIVVAAGHAGTEAALAAGAPARARCCSRTPSRPGPDVLQPSIGGIGKGHLVREVDALGGAMAHRHGRGRHPVPTLNAARPGVCATAQADRVLYRARSAPPRTQPNLWLFQRRSTTSSWRATASRRVTAIGLRFGRARVLTPALPGGLIHVGLELGPAAPAIRPRFASRAPARARTARLGRLKTGTPPRIDGRTIDFSKLEEQPGDRPEPVFSFMGARAMHPRQSRAGSPTRTSAPTRSSAAGSTARHVHRGDRGRGPAVLPLHRGQDPPLLGKDSHQIFLEPEGLATHEFYPNGISTSLPFDVQQDLVHSIAGLENAHILRPGYAIEYDYFDPRGLKATLETRRSRASSSPADQRHDGLRGGRGAGPARGLNAALRARARRAGARAATRPTWACWWTTS